MMDLPATAAVDPRALALSCLMQGAVEQKLLDTAAAGAAILQADQLLDSIGTAVVPRMQVPGRPAKPELVEPKQLLQRKLNTLEGRAALIHAVAHIEFNAINLAWDAEYRFAGMPAAYYRDWASVAVDEARHFQLLQTRLQELGYAYGDFPAHNGLWQMALLTDHDVLVRMALVPRVLEARGLDVTPGMIERLQRAGDGSTVSILELILREEVRHVAIGSRWFAYLCQQRRLDPAGTFMQLLREHPAARPRSPLNVEARLAAGFDATELEAFKEFP